MLVSGSVSMNKKPSVRFLVAIPFLSDSWRRSEAEDFVGDEAHNGSPSAKEQDDEEDCRGLSSGAKHTQVQTATLANCCGGHISCL